MEEFYQRRKPARPRRIAEVMMGDEMVGVIGLVVDISDSEFTLDDGTGRLMVTFDDPALVEDVAVGSKVRVFGVPRMVSGASELHADIVQRLDKLDLNLYREVRREAERLDRDLGVDYG
ncbi:MAG: hypothetical protein ACUVQM_00670 [Candidatus Hadarchaeaceae archaeon]